MIYLSKVLKKKIRTFCINFLKLGALWLYTYIEISRLDKKPNSLGNKPCKLRAEEEEEVPAEEQEEILHSHLGELPNALSVKEFRFVFLCLRFLFFSLPWRNVFVNEYQSPWRPKTERLHAASEEEKGFFASRFRKIGIKRIDRCF